MANNWIIRYGSYRMLGEFEGLEEELSRGDFVILQTDRGTETGQILCKSDEKSKKITFWCNCRKNHSKNVGE